MGVGLTLEEYDEEQDEWQERIYRISKAINETVRAADRMSERELYDLIDAEWDK